MGFSCNAGTILRFGVDTDLMVHQHRAQGFSLKVSLGFFKAVYRPFSSVEYAVESNSDCVSSERRRLKTAYVNKLFILFYFILFCESRDMLRLDYHT